jgi:anti-sigma factor RsiW
MYRVSTAAFRKHKTCPTTDVLVLYSGSELTRGRRERVERHLGNCDFCGAEMQLLSKHYAHGDATACPAPREIPQHLRRLAEELMSQPRSTARDSSNRLAPSNASL